MVTVRLTDGLPVLVVLWLCVPRLLTVVDGVDDMLRLGFADRLGDLLVTDDLLSRVDRVTEDVAVDDLETIEDAVIDFEAVVVRVLVDDPVLVRDTVVVLDSSADVVLDFVAVVVCVDLAEAVEDFEDVVVRDSLELGLDVPVAATERVDVRVVRPVCDG